MNINNSRMKKRIITKIGDVFEVQLGSYKKYFQYIANDMTQLNSSVIRVFAEEYPIDYPPILEDITSGKVDFYAHTVLRSGIQSNLWYKIGKINFDEEVNILFRDCDEDKYVPVSKRWRVWNINQPMKFIEKLRGKNRDAEIGIVFQPERIINRMRTGSYQIKYPDFE